MTAIGQNAFDGCPELAKVDYRGSEGEWANIPSVSGNDILKKAAVTYANENPNLDEDKGLSLTVIIIIAVAAVGIAAVVSVVIIKKKKSKK